MNLLDRHESKVNGWPYIECILVHGRLAGFDARRGVQDKLLWLVLDIEEEVGVSVLEYLP